MSGEYLSLLERASFILRLRSFVPLILRLSKHVKCCTAAKLVPETSECEKFIQIFIGKMQLPITISIPAQGKLQLKMCLTSGAFSLKIQMASFAIYMLKSKILSIGSIHGINLTYENPSTNTLKSNEVLSLRCIGENGQQTISQFTH